MSYEIDERDVPEQAVVTIKAETTPQELGDAYGELLPEVARHAAAAGASMTGPPFGRYHSWSEERVEVEAGAPVDGVVDDGERVRSYRLPGFHAASTVHVGPYEGVGAAHDALVQWAKENGRQIAGAPMEIYVTDPGEEPDPTKWRTMVLLPVTGATD